MDAVTAHQLLRQGHLLQGHAVHLGLRRRQDAGRRNEDGRLHDGGRLDRDGYREGDGSIVMRNDGLAMLFVLERSGWLGRQL